MTILLVFFGFFTLLSGVALVKFEGNPIFIFTLALCVASLVTIWQIDREASPRSGSPARRPARRRR